MTKALVSDDLWSIVQPLLPAEPLRPKGGRPRVSDRAALIGILSLAALGYPVGDAAAGDEVRLGRDVLEAAARLATSRVMAATVPRVAAAFALGRLHRLEPSVYGQRVNRGKKGGAATGPNPTDRGKAGTKRHLPTDRHGLSLAFVLTGANVHDSVPLAELLDTVAPVRGKRGRPRQRPAKLHADKSI